MWRNKLTIWRRSPYHFASPLDRVTRRFLAPQACKPKVIISSNVLINSNMSYVIRGTVPQTRLQLWLYINLRSARSIVIWVLRIHLWSFVFHFERLRYLDVICDHGKPNLSPMRSSVIPLLTQVVIKSPPVNVLLVQSGVPDWNVQFGDWGWS